MLSEPRGGHWVPPRGPAVLLTVIGGDTHGHTQDRTEATASAADAKTEATLVLGTPRDPGPGRPVNHCLYDRSIRRWDECIDEEPEDTEG